MPSRRPKRKLYLLIAVVLLAGGAAMLVPHAREAVEDWRVDRHMSHIRRHADFHGLPPELVRAVIEVESSGRPGVRSNRDAVGLMQITPITLKDVRLRNPDIPKGDLRDPSYNILIGTTYLRYLLDRFNDNLKLALAAYHMGPTAVAKGLKQYPDLTTDELIQKIAGPKTRAYVRNVMREAGDGLKETGSRLSSPSRNFGENEVTRLAAFSGPSIHRA